MALMLEEEMNRIRRYGVKLTTEEQGKTTSESDVVYGVSPMDAIRTYGAERGWNPSADSLDDDAPSNSGCWTLTESDGSVISVWLED